LAVELVAVVAEVARDPCAANLEGGGERAMKKYTRIPVIKPLGASWKWAGDAAQRIAELEAEVERLREERDRLATALTTELANYDDAGRIDVEHLRAALMSLSVRKDAQQAEAGGGKSRRSGEGPH
jgi:hypothetical protein